MSSDTPTIKTNKTSNLALIIGLFLIVIILVGTFLSYQFVIVPGQVRDSLNKNIEVNNTVLNKVKPLVVDITSKATSINDQMTAGAGDIQTTVNQIDDLTQKTSEIDSVIQEIANQKSKLDDGSVAETRDFKQLVSQNLDNTESSVKEFKNFIQYQSCISKKYLSVADSFGKLFLELNKATELDTSPIIAGSVYNEQAGKALSEIKLCFVGDYSKYLTPAISDGLDAAVAYTTSVSESYSKLAGLRVGIALAEDISAQQIDLITNIATIPSFLTDDTAIMETINSPVADLNVKLSKLDEQDKKINDKLAEIKQKYRL